MRREFLAGGLAAVLSVPAAFAQPAAAQSYPDKNVRIVVPFTAGGAPE